jgi:polyisoprenoid-binding protein YceI
MNLRPIYPLAALALALSAPFVVAQAPQIPGTKDKSRVVAGNYVADPGHTMVVWEVDHLGFSDYSGIFGDVTGTLSIDPANLAAAKVDVTIPIDKVTTASAGLTAHLLKAAGADGKADFFGATPAPARFVSTSVVLDDDGDEAKITGNLTLNGVTRPVTLEAEFKGAGAHPMNKKINIGFEAETKIRRSEFGIGYGIPAVSDEVELKIHAAFEKQ